MNIQKSHILIILILVILIGGGLIVFVNQKTKTIPPAVNPPSELPQNQSGNFVLYVSNQSFALDPVDIKIYIDGKVAVNQDFYVEDQHNWQKFQFSLSQGNHKVYVVSTKGQANLEEQFEIKDKHWAVVDYRYYPESHYSPTPKHFSFDISDKPIYFK